MNATASTTSAVAPSRFIDNGDGTVTDPKTSLIWLKATLGNGQPMTHEKALEAIAALGPEWRIPEFDELHSLVDRSRYNPAIDTSAFADTQNCAYWTSEKTAWASRAVWVVYFGNGHSYDCLRDDSACVRAVRSVSAGQ